MSLLSFTPDVEHGPGVGTQAEVDELRKALTVGSDISAPSPVTAGDGFALRVESLESTLKNTTYKMKHIRMWKDIPKMKAYNTVEEHNEQSAYGETERYGFIAEGGSPLEEDSTIERKYAQVKYLGTKRKVSHVSTVIRSAHGNNVIARETVSGSMHLLRMMERNLFYGSSSLSSVQFDGLFTLMEANAPSTNIIDMRGLPLNQDVLSDAAMVAFDAPNYGQISHMYCNPKVKADLLKIFYPNSRFDTLDKPKNGMVGLDVRGMETPAGDMEFVPDVFIQDGGAAPSAASGSATLAPTSLTISTSATTPVDATAQFTADDAGDYYYKIAGFNKYGGTAAIAVDGSAISIAAGDKMTFGVTPTGTVEWYEIYRTVKGGASGTERLILRVANAAGAGEQTINDLNANLPGCTSAFLGQMDFDGLAFKQLIPMVKIPLAVVDTNIQWLQLIYGVPVIYAPGKHVVIKNIGRTSGNYA